MGISLIRKPDPKVGLQNAGSCGVLPGFDRGQTLDAQIDELKRAGATKLYAEKQSGARADRPQLRRAIGALGEGDTLLVTRIDRLARSTRDLLNTLQVSMNSPIGDEVSTQGSASDLKAAPRSVTVCPGTKVKGFSGGPVLAG